MRTALLALGRLGTTALLTATVIAFGACTSSGSLASLAEGCVLSSDCRSPDVCVFQTCHTQCATSADCSTPAGSHCVLGGSANVCEPPIPCTYSTQCPGSEICGADRECRDQCKSAKDCVNGQSCADGVCADPSDLRADGGLAGAADGGIGDPCVYNSDCPSPLVCLASLCDYQCKKTVDCPLGQTCESNVCAFPHADAGAPDSRNDGSSDKDSGCGSCAAGATCVGGQCACANAEVVCGAACVDKASDPGNCGACGATCLGGLCESGACVCSGADTLCGGQCVDEQTDSHQCGGCGLVCSVPCVSGECVIELAAAQQEPRAIAVDATNMYWTDTSGTVLGILSEPVTGGLITTLASATGGIGLGIAIDGASIYWVNEGTSANAYADGSVLMTGKTGGAPITLASGQTAPSAIATDAANVYWINLGSGISTASVMKGGKTPGGAPVTLASAQTAAAIAVDATNVYWVNRGTSGTSGDGAVMSIPIGGAAMPTVLVPGLTGPAAIAVDAANVYWMTSATLMKVPVGGGPPTTLATAGSSEGTIAVDGTNVYWTSYDGVSSSILKVAASGGAPVSIAIDQLNPFSIAVDATSVYWTDVNGNSVAGSIRKATPK